MKLPIVIVGAGVAGLAAARALHKRGHAVCVLEARSRIGGRTWSRHDPAAAAPIELGAEFVHGDAPHTQHIVRAAGLDVLPSAGGFWAARSGRLSRSPFGREVDRVLRHIDRHAPDEPFARFLARRPGGRTLAKDRAAAAAFVQGFHAADLARMSTHALAPEPGEAPSGAATHSSRLAGPQSDLARWLAAGLGPRVRLRHVVTGIAWERGAARVHVQGVARALRARAVVITAPVGVLQAPEGARGAIAFDPDPPALRRALQGLAMGAVTKVDFAFTELPWARLARTRGRAELATLGFLRTPESAFNVWWSVDPAHATQAVAWAGGPPGAALAERPRTEIVATALRYLARALGVPYAALARTVRGAWTHDWVHDPFARGAYSYPAVGGAGAGRALARPIAGTLFFAGEATAPAWGTVEGAIGSGMRAARQVERALAG